MEKLNKMLCEQNENIKKTGRKPKKKKQILDLNVLLLK